MSVAMSGFDAEWLLGGNVFLVEHFDGML